VWFVPHTCKEEVIASIAAVRQLTGSNSSLLIVNMEDDGEGGEHRATVTAGVNNDIESAMQAAKAAINDYTEALEAAENDSNLRGPQQRTALRSLKEIKELENKISTYQDILQLKTDNINSTLNAFKDFWKLALGV
jgi:cellobiose-specific phosphotransferase system component IIB